MRYIYGPVRSRRLGFSLGVSPVPYKVCSFNCVYCQLKGTTHLTLRRKRYIAEQEILSELSDFFKHKKENTQVDYITFSGSGEPTLHASIGGLIRKAKGLAAAPVVLITNGCALTDPEVRRQVLCVDLIIPSLDAVTRDVFEKIDRPCPGVSIQAIIKGLIAFRRHFRGRMWLEIMLVRGINDAPAYLRKIKKVTDLIEPDRIQINVPARTPAESWVKPPTRATLRQAKKIFGDTCDIVGDV